MIVLKCIHLICFSLVCVVYIQILKYNFYHLSAVLFTF